MHMRKYTKHATASSRELPDNGVLDTVMMHVVVAFCTPFAYLRARLVERELVPKFVRDLCFCWKWR